MEVVPMIHLYLHLELQRERNRRLARRHEISRLRAREVAAEPFPKPLLLSVRPGDDEDLIRLAALNEAPAPSGPHVVASVDGEVIAARALESERMLTDPFRRTAHLPRLLALHAKCVLSDRAA
jgi:hypothetical protein